MSKQNSKRCEIDTTLQRQSSENISLHNMMPTAEGMTHMMPSHVLRVGQTLHLEQTHDAAIPHPCGDQEDRDLDISLDNLNQLILELDPTFEPIQVNQSSPCTRTPTDDSCSDEDVSNFVLVPRGCSPATSIPSISPCTPAPLSCSPNGTVVFSSSPSSTLPPLPGGSAPRRVPSPKTDSPFGQGSLRLSHTNRNSASSLRSTSTCSDTSYILGSNLSLASEDADSPESIFTHTSGSFSDGSRMRTYYNRRSPEKSSVRQPSQQALQPGAQSGPASLSSSLTDVPVLLVNGAPQPDLQIQPPGPENDSMQTNSVSNSKPFPLRSFQASFSGSQPSMKFVMDTSKYWFRPHVTRAEAEAMVKDKGAGTFVVRDSTSYKGSFGLAMKVDQTSANHTGTATHPEQNGSALVQHFLIESSAKGVRVKGSSQEPYFGSLSALVYQHTVSQYALPCKLLLQFHDVGAGEEKPNDKPATQEGNRTSSNFVYLNAVPVEMLTGPCAVRKAVSSTLDKAAGSLKPAVVNMKVSLKGVTLSDINRKLFFRRHYPAHLLSYSGEDPDSRLWLKGCSFGARMFGFVAKGVEASMENMCHVFAEYDPLQPCNKAIEGIQAAIKKP